MKRPAPFILRLAIAVKAMSACAVALYVIACQSPGRMPHRYLIPDGYVGWVRTDSEVRDFPELKTEDGFLVFVIPSEGLLQTSSKFAYGVAADEYYYYSNDTRRKLPVTSFGAGGMIWGRANGSSKADSGESIYEYFFVGSEAQLETLGRKAYLEGRPQPGNLTQ